MTKRVAIIGASIGGLIAAAELRARGLDVTILERGKSIGGLYGKVETPFGTQELGMHVLYLSEPHYRHLSAIFGADVLQTWQGNKVDIGGCYNFGTNFFDSIYPDVRGLPSAGTILEQVLQKQGAGVDPANALNAAIGRFGEEAGRNVVAPILAKLWKQPAERLSSGALHCFFDLRRIVVCDKPRADKLKQDPWLDTVIANPLQSQPSGEVFGGRMAVRFKNSAGDVSGRAQTWLASQGIHLELERRVEIAEERLVMNGAALNEAFDACLIATPMAGLAPSIQPSLDQLELSIFYFQLNNSVADYFPAYYLLCHSPELASSRIVNYQAYQGEEGAARPSVLAVEVLHPLAAPPTEDTVAAELTQVLPFAEIGGMYRLPKSLRMPIPSLNNANLVDGLTSRLSRQFGDKPLYFTGMRTDKGVFFSHHTIGQAYDSAVDCASRFS